MIAKNSDNQLIQLVGPTSNYINTVLFHSVSFYYLLFTILFQQFVDLFILVSHEDHIIECS